MTNDKPRLLDLNPAELEALMAALGEPRFRARQVWDWLYRQLATDFDAMTSLPKSLRAQLAESAVIDMVEPVAETWSADRMAQKFLFRLRDGQLVESVLMHYEDEAAAVADADEGVTRGAGRHTVCISSQVGCAMGCVFCATGQMGLLRNLTPGEIVAQVLYAERILRRDGARVTNVVYMGMGEPLANFNAVWRSVETLHDPHGFNLGARRITLSTVGLVPGMRRLAEQDLPINLALSIHGATDEVRDTIVPINTRYALADIIAAARDYIAKTGRRLTVEWVLIQDVNDTPQQAERLADLLRGMLVHVNLIPLNPTAGYDGKTPTPARSLQFRDTLAARGIPTTLRMRRGIDVQAGCGQLRTQIVGGRPTSINPTLIATTDHRPPTTG
ncbi:MAG: 23S rRNA (adenine(2503)-C(2))-methyltransferase RlmN [Anaerolineae bacterium]|nr:23S rRNA (adenine(2503)-C(2))-methyltransferase RlmN [Anaerolineae bacterium]